MNDCQGYSLNLKFHTIDFNAFDTNCLNINEINVFLSRFVEKLETQAGGNHSILSGARISSE